MDYSTIPWLFVLITVLLFLYRAAITHNDHFTTLEIPFHKPLPIFGSFAAMIFRRQSFGDLMWEIYRSFDDSGICGYFEFLTPVLMVRDPELIKQVTVNDFDCFTDHRTPITEEEDKMLGRNLLVLQGQRWRNMRHTLTPAFTPSKMKAMFLLVAECGEQLAYYLDKQYDEEGEAMLTVDMRDLFSRFGTDVLATSAFGAQVNSLDFPDNEFYKVGKNLTDISGAKALTIVGYILCAKLMMYTGLTVVSGYTTNFFRTLIRDSIEMREREGTIRPDLVHLLRQAQKGTLEAEATDKATAQSKDHKARKILLTDDDIVAQAMLFFFGGFDTNATLLCFLTHQLAANPDIQDRLRKEVDDILEGEDGVVTYEATLRMKYMDMVISETLRINPPDVFSDRLCVKPCTLRATATSPEVRVKVGDGIAIPIIGIQRDEKYWKDPLKFDPERFSEGNKQKIVPYTYIPFGAGPRACLGMRFALMQAKIAVATLLSRFEIHVVDRTALDVPVKLSKGGFNTNAQKGFWLGIKPRVKK